MRNWRESLLLSIISNILSQFVLRGQPNVHIFRFNSNVERHRISFILIRLHTSIILLAAKKKIFFKNVLNKKLVFSQKGRYFVFIVLCTLIEIHKPYDHTLCIRIIWFHQRYTFLVHTITRIFEILAYIAELIRGSETHAKFRNAKKFARMCSSSTVEISSDFHESQRKFRHCNYNASYIIFFLKNCDNWFISQCTKPGSCVW